MGGIHFTPEERAYIESQIRKGEAYKTISRRTGRPASSIARLARGIGIQKKKSPAKPRAKPEPKGVIALQDDPENLARVAPEMIKPEAKPEGRGLEALFERGELGPLARFCEEARSMPGAVKLPDPVPRLVTPRKPDLPGLEYVGDGNFRITAIVPTEYVIDQLIARGGTSPHEIIKWALCYLRDEEGKIAPPDLMRIIAEATGASL